MLLRNHTILLCGNYTKQETNIAGKLEENWCQWSGDRRFAVSYYQLAWHLQCCSDHFTLSQPTCMLRSVQNTFWCADVSKLWFLCICLDIWNGTFQRRLCHQLNLPIPIITLYNGRNNNGGICRAQNYLVHLNIYGLKSTRNSGFGLRWVDLIKSADSDTIFWSCNCYEEWKDQRASLDITIFECTLSSWHLRNGCF